MAHVLAVASKATNGKLAAFISADRIKTNEAQPLCIRHQSQHANWQHHPKFTNFRDGRAHRFPIQLWHQRRRNSAPATDHRPHS